jgi:UDP-glucose 4-epimerase
MRYLITGGAGFIGSHAADFLLARGDTVYALDDLSTGSLANVAHLTDHPAFTLLIGPAADFDLMASLVDEVDAVIHLAAAVGVQLVIEKPVHTIYNNLRPTETVLELAAKDHKPVLIASTSEVYGKSERLPFNEEDPVTIGPPTKSRWGYAASKLMDEFLAMAYWAEQQLPVVVVRYFNTVGPRQSGRYGMVIPRFVRQALEGEAITVYGDGQQTRSFGYVGDVVRGTVALLNAGRRAHGEIVNLGNNDEVTIRQLAERVIERTGSSSHIVTTPYKEAYPAGFDEMRRRVPDLGKARRLVRYEPTVGLDEIIDRVAAFERGKS